MKYGFTLRRVAALVAAGSLAIMGVVAAQPPSPATAAQGTGGLFVPLTGQVANTLLGEGLPKAKLAGLSPKLVQVAGVSGIPVDNVTAVALTVVAQNTTANGQMSLGPGTGALSGVMRYMANDITSNTAIAEVDENGQVQVQVTTPADIVLKVQGYYTAGNGDVSAGGYQPVTMTRTVDTVNGVGLPKAKISGGQTVSIQVTGKAGVPTGASAAFVNFQVNSPVGSTGSINPYATSPTSRPSNALSFPANNPNYSIGAIVPLDASGKFQLYLSPGNTIDLLMDVEGYFTKTDSVTAGAFKPAVAKVYDTRATASVAPDAIVTIPLAGNYGIPSKKLGLSAAALNLTVIATGTGGGSVRAWPSGTAEPTNVGDLTFKTGTYTNLMTVAIGADGAIKMHNRSADPVDLILDLEGWYAVAPQPTISCPAAYQNGKWTNTIPSAPVQCLVTLPDTGDTDGFLTVVVDEGDVEEIPIPATGAVSHPIQVPNESGWHTVTTSAEFTSGMTANAQTAFGLQEGTPSPTIATIQKVRPETFLNVSSAQPTPSGTVAVKSTAAEAATSSAEVASDPATGITVTSEASTSYDETGTPVVTPASSVSVELPFSETSNNAVAEAPGVVSFNNNNGSSTVSVVKKDTSVQNLTVISNPSAPTRYAYPFELPVGSVLSLDDTGSAVVTAADGTFIGGVSAPWAIDANGSDVPTRFEVVGNTLTQVVDHTAATAFPVVADPWVGKKLIEKIAWTSNGKTLQVFPTAYAKGHRCGKNLCRAPAAARGQAWKDTVAKMAVRDLGKGATPSMRDQFYCHWDFAATIWRDKPSWNLDTWRPHVAYPVLVAKFCNN